MPKNSTYTVNVRRTMTQNLLERNFINPPAHEACGALDIVESMKKYIFENDCPVMSMDVSHLNVIDASKVAILCSTYHYAKYPHGHIDWFVNSSEIKNLVKPLNLGNIDLITV